MSDTEKRVGGTGAEAAYDAVVHKPAGETRDQLLERAIKGVGLDAAKADVLVENLFLYGSAKVKGNVPKSAAEEVVKRFAKAGFMAEALPVLAISEEKAPTHCPGCDAQIQPTEDNRCPECGIYMHKVSQETLDRKRIERDEKRKIEARKNQGQDDSQKNVAAEKERVLRERIRGQLEKQYGLDGGQGSFFYKNRNLMLPLLLLGIAGAFLFGRVSSGEQLMAVVGMAPKEEAKDKGSGVNPDMVNRFLQNANANPAQQQALLEKLSGMAGQSGDPLDIQSIVNGGAPGAAGAQPAGIPQATYSTGGAPTPASPPAAGTPPRPAGDGIAQAGEAPVPLADADRLRALNELAIALAEVGQLSRANEVFAKMQSVSGKTNDLATALLLRQTRIRLEAWGLTQAPAEKVRPGMESLSVSISEIPQAAGRAIEFAEAAAILAGAAQLSAQEAENFYGQAAKTLQLERDEPSRRAATGALLVAKGKGLMARAQTKAERGAWKEVAGLAQEIAAILAAVKEPEHFIRLSGYQYQILSLQGRTEEAHKVLGAALAQVDKYPAADSRAHQKAWLLGLPEAAGFEGLVSSMQREFRGAERLAPELQAAVLSEVAQGYAAAGMKKEADEAIAQFSTVANGSGAGVLRRWNLNKFAVPAAYIRHYRRGSHLAAMETQIRAAARIVM